MSISPYLAQIILSALILIVTYSGRFFIIKALENSSLKSDDLKRRWIYQIKTWSVGLALLVIILIWSSQIHSFLIGILTFLVAIIIATKELILCLTGGIYRIVASPFNIGDKIEINGISGEVIDQSIFMTKLLELGMEKHHDFTGKVITIPNSLFLSHFIKNENLSDDYIIHNIIIPLPNTDQLLNQKEKLLDLAKTVFQEYQNKISDAHEKLIKKKKINQFALAPKVSYQLIESNKTNLVLRLPVPDELKHEIEQKIIEKFYH